MACSNCISFEIAIFLLFKIMFANQSNIFKPKCKNSITNTTLRSSMKGIKITMRPHLYGHSNRALGIEDHPTWYHIYYKGPIFPVEM